MAVLRAVHFSEQAVTVMRLRVTRFESIPQMQHTVVAAMITAAS